MLPEGPLIGRERELLALAIALRADRLITVTGAGGCGKTRVARELATRLRSGSEPAEVVVVELASVRRPYGVVGALVRGLGVRERPGLTQMEVLSDRLAVGPIVLVIDNCEHVVGEVARLALWLLDVATEIRIVSTSRAPLGLAGERVFSLAPLGLPEAGGDVASVVRSDAARLFVDRAAAADPSFALTPSAARAVVRICHELDGLPLALELAAARIEHLPPGEIAEGLMRRGRLAGADAEDTLPQHRSLRASLDWSYELLDDAGRRLFRSLSVFSGGWETAAAHAVVLAEGDATQVAGRLAELERKGLVVAQAVGEETRWSFLQTVGDYAAGRLAEDPVEQAMMRDQHLTWCVAFAATVDELLLTVAGHAMIDRESPISRWRSTGRAAPIPPPPPSWRGRCCGIGSWLSTSRRAVPPPRGCWRRRPIPMTPAPGRRCAWARP
jgi:predicted ATPase